MFLSYDGAAYHGWQTQPNGVSVQEVVEKCLSVILRQDNIKVTAAGRTDAGVNAIMMPVHFDINGKLPNLGNQAAKHTPEEELQYKLNSFLPQSIAVNKIVAVKNDAHARFSAVSRTYYYNIAVTKKPFLSKYSLYVPYKIDIDAMNTAAAKLLGKHDFDCFAKAHPDVKSSICNVTHAAWKDNHDGTLRFEITADRFLRNMVRAIVGTLLDIGRGKINVNDLGDILESKNRCRAGESVDGKALFLANVVYPEDIFINK